jgi:adenine-specific DNA methylase
MSINYLIKLILFTIFINLIGNVTNNILANEVIVCNKLNVTSTDITIYDINKINNVLSVFYLCNDKEIKQFYMIDSIYNKNPFKEQFTVYKNMFGQTSSYYTNLFGNLISYMIIGPIIFPIIKDVWTIIMNF